MAWTPSPAREAERRTLHGAERWVRSCSMAERFVNVDWQTPMFLPPDLREWVADNELAHLILEATELCDLRAARLTCVAVAASNIRPR